MVFSADEMLVFLAIGLVVFYFGRRKRSIKLTGIGGVISAVSLVLIVLSLLGIG